MTNLTSEWLNNASPYISTWIYDIDSRKIILECVDTPEKMNPTKRITLTDVIEYREETIDDEYDDQCLDSVIGIHWISDNVLCIHTEKKEIIVKIGNEPTIVEL